jgi:hypothetical protein
MILSFFKNMHEKTFRIWSYAQKQNIFFERENNFLEFF